MARMFYISGEATGAGVVTPLVILCEGEAVAPARPKGVCVIAIHCFY